MNRKFILRALCVLLLVSLSCANHRYTSSYEREYDEAPTKYETNSYPQHYENRQREADYDERSYGQTYEKPEYERYPTKRNSYKQPEIEVEKYTVEERYPKVDKYTDEERYPKVDKYTDEERYPKVNKYTVEERYPKAEKYETEDKYTEKKAYKPETFYTPEYKQADSYTAAPKVETYENLKPGYEKQCQSYKTNGYDYASDKYVSLSAKKKFDLLWSEIEKDQRTGRMPTNYQHGQLFTQDPAVTISYDSDVMPCYRRKLIHVQGLMQKAIWKAEYDHPYTGIFKKTQPVIIRYSLADTIDFSYVKEGASGEAAYQLFSPSIAIKILQDGKHSVNLFGMYTFDGQKSWNWWKNDLSNILPNPKDEGVEKLHQRFSQATIYTQLTGLKYAARNYQAGKYNKVAKSHQPFKLIYKPNEEYQKMFKDTYNSTENWIYQIKAVKQGEELYSVWAVEDPVTGCQKKIGSIVADSYAILSRFGDEKLFFKHQDWKLDLQDRPEWIPFSPSRNPYLRPFKPMGQCKYAKKQYEQEKPKQKGY